jgi:uncharacterized membrane protein
VKGEAYKHIGSNWVWLSVQGRGGPAFPDEAEKDYLIDLEDAVVAVKDQKGKVRLHQAVNLTAVGALSGGFWGTLIGMIFLNPLLGIAMGAAAGTVSGALRMWASTTILWRNWRQTWSRAVRRCLSWCERQRRAKLLDEIKGTGGKILQTSLSHEDEAKLQAALSAPKQ